MIELINHLTGMCGESHINLIAIILIFILVKTLLNKNYDDKKLF